jgi:RNA polymerase sigma-70 factor, ECF subfamily
VTNEDRHKGVTDFVMAEKAMAATQPEESLVEVAVRDHARLVYRIAYSVLRSSEEAEDAVQETFLRVLRYESKLNGVRDQKAWLAQIAWRVAVERRRQVTVHAARTEEAGNNLLASGHSADQALLEKERSVVLHVLIAGLPDELRDPLVLSTLEELSPREIGSMLGISEAAVRSRAFRARQILRERLEVRMGVKK